MIQISSEIEEAHSMTLQGIEESDAALEQLKSDCVAAAQIMTNDMVEGARAVPTVVDAVHQFIVFEQQVVELFEVDTESVASDDDSLWQTELDMHNLLMEFNEKSDASDVVGVANLLGTDLPDLLTRFQVLLPLLKDRIESDGTL